MTIKPTRRSVVAGAAATVAFGGLARPALAQGATALKVIVFPGLSNLSIFAAQHRGLFKKHGLEIELINTPNSGVLRNGIAKGDYHLGHAACDNAVAMVEIAKADVILAMGGDNGLNRVIVQPEIKSYADLRGKTVVVDAPNTAFALLLYKVLKDAGLNKGDYTVKPVGGTPARLKAMLEDKANAAAGIMNPPSSFAAVEKGLKDMGSAARAIGAYQSDTLFVMRPWAKANGDTVIRYIKAYVEGRRWALDPKNKDEVTKLLADRLKLSPKVAAQSYAAATDAADGIVRDAKFDLEGFRNVLKLRAEIEGQWGGNPPAPGKYFDMSYYDKALAGL
ncbi:MAG: ABC transporter substrate-binding protein [Alphaproteobacteria bacterium]|nr:ABC transporter substrate-binding protein [Alphaproteobacteria bacterium]